MSQNKVNININIRGKSFIVAYVLWWFLGFIGLHRFYLERTVSGLLMLLLTVVGLATAYVGFGFLMLASVLFWWLLDAILTFFMVSTYNNLTGQKTNVEIEDVQVGNSLNELEKLYDLYQKGVFTKEEYEQKRSKYI